MRFLISRHSSKAVTNLLRRSFVSQSVVPEQRIQLVALDIDGTLLDANRKLHTRVKDAIVKVTGLGVPVLLSTGRCPAIATKLINAGQDFPLPLSGGIFLGGAIGQDGFGKIQRDVKLNVEVVHRVLAFCEEHELTIVLNGSNSFWCSEQNVWTQRLVDADDPMPSGVGKLALKRKAEKVHLICIMGDRDLIDNVQMKLAHLVENYPARVVRPLDWMLHVVSLDTSTGLSGKAAGLAELCSWRGISAESVMAVGDSGNDVDMLHWAGWAVAMGNASNSAIAVADVVVASNSDATRPGVAEALEEFVINPRLQTE